MSVAEPFWMEARQGIFIVRGGILAIKPSCVPLLGVSMEFDVGIGDFFPFLNGHTAKFGIRAVGEFGTAVQMKEISK